MINKAIESNNNQAGLHIDSLMRPDATGHVTKAPYTILKNSRDCSISKILLLSLISLTEEFCQKNITLFEQIDYIGSKCSHSNTMNR